LLASYTILSIVYYRVFFYNCFVQHYLELLITLATRNRLCSLINLISLSTYKPFILASRPRFESYNTNNECTCINVDICLRLLFGRFDSGYISNFILERLFREKLLETCKFLVVYKLDTRRVDMSLLYNPLVNFCQSKAWSCYSPFTQNS